MIFTINGLFFFFTNLFTYSLLSFFSQYWSKIFEGNFHVTMFVSQQTLLILTLFMDGLTFVKPLLWGKVSTELLRSAKKFYFVNIVRPTLNKYSRTCAVFKSWMDERKSWELSNWCSTISFLIKPCQFHFQQLRNKHVSENLQGVRKLLCLLNSANKTY